jgi:formate hydrogenlyase subunit 3/multisubunit Na+/H+ antiporter MnhD subunit
LLAYRDTKALAPQWFFFNLFVASMALVVVARNAVLFLVSWEMMSVTAFFLVTFEHEKRDVRAAGWIYLVATHLGAAFLLAMFLLLGRQAHSLDFDDFAVAATNLAPAVTGLVFVLALIGFGAKAGFVPLHVWLPEAHPAAPSHVSALMSGVMIKIGIYGVLRTMMLLAKPAAWWGPVLVIIGLAGGVLGVSLAVFQRDLKRALAYSSIENVGLIMLALGVGVWGITSAHPTVAILGLAGGLLHIWNHSLMKGLMFLSAGSVLHGTGTKDLERLGGLMKRMPRTGVAMTLGALAIAAVPPLNGFVSEWLIFMAMLRGGLEFTGVSRTGLLLAAGVLAFIGGLASICFVRLVGIVLLGQSRSEQARHAHESSGWMTVPLGVLAAFCVVAGVLPTALVSIF